MEGMEEDGRIKFMSKLTALYSKKPQNTYIVSKFDYMNRMQRLTDLNDPQTQRTSTDQKLLKNCCIVNDPTTNQLKLCKPGTTLAYVPLEELYDVLLGIHLNLNHAGRNCMQRAIRTCYCNISKDCVMIFLTTCKNCPRTKRMNGVTKKHVQSNEEEESDDEVDIVNAPNQMNEIKKESNNSVSANVLSTTPLNFATPKPITKQESDNFSRGQIDLFEMTKSKDGNYSWFLRFTNCQTRKITLKPIISGSVPEIANVLLDIYCDQGAPVVLQSLNGREFVQQVIVEINKIYPQCRQLHSDIVGTTESNIILNQLHALMQKFNTDGWASLLRILQFEINSTYRSDINSSPFQLTYNRMPSMGLRNSKLIDILYERSNYSMDDFMDFLADAELIRMSAFCQQTENKQQAPIIRPCDDFVGFSSNTYSPISTNGIPTTSTISQIVCTPDSIPHSSTSSNNSFYQPAATPTLPQNNSYHALTNLNNVAQPTTPNQTQQSNDHFPVTSFESPTTHSPNNYYPSVTSAQIVASSESMVKEDGMMTSEHDQLNDLQMNC